MKFLEWHFHTYFDETDPAAVEKANTIRNALVDILHSPEDRPFVAVPLHHFFPDSDQVKPRDEPNYGLNMKPIGPHPVGSFETWAPVESFAAVYDWFLNNRNGLDILVHPLTNEEVKDHSVNATWMGTPQPLKLSFLREWTPEPALQYPHFGLGYSKKQDA
ncbi:unnamed protein product [Aphanomyces euteiches]|uniref:DOPA 4,5-dioxygenase n=1 Tax=Aphanomyces euteiches TaxID=100861 RepID=A0A6G0X4H3_9STRA|nr:hypothetical protein Ae201684_008613 [Aphanomyces euteiches]KAH9085369.1 hypothetical protein Ae201684P_005078 [Aphanomyces euteiches]KAH9139949.1 hypothetical protein AeRB84_015774 [Aphanomyces euteiches]